MLQYFIPHWGHSVIKLLFISQHSLCGTTKFGLPVNLRTFSSAVSSGLRQWSHAKYPNSEFHRNWQQTTGLSSSITSPSLNARLENSPFPCKANTQINNPFGDHLRRTSWWIMEIMEIVQMRTYNRKCASPSRRSLLWWRSLYPP